MIPVYKNSLGDEAVLCFADRAPLCSVPLHLKKKEAPADAARYSHCTGFCRSVCYQYHPVQCRIGCMIPQAILSPEFPDGCVVKSSGFA